MDNLSERLIMGQKSSQGRWTYKHGSEHEARLPGMEAL